MQVHVPGRQLADLAEAATKTEFFHRHFAQVLEHGADEVTHFDQGNFRQVVDPTHRVFAGIAGARGDVQVTVGPGDIDALMDRGNVRRAGKWPDDAAGAKNRQAAENPQARVHGFQRQFLAAFDVHRDLETAAVAEFIGQSGQVIGDHFARHRVDRRFADAQHQPRPGDGADTASGLETDTRFADEAYPGVEQGAVGHVRIIASVFDGARFGAVLGRAAKLQAHLHLFAFGQDDLHGIRAHPAEQQASRRKAGCRRATARGQATAQGGGLFGGFVTHREASSHPAR